MKNALIFGINGQDGSYLADFLLHKGYKVSGIIRKKSDTSLINHLLHNENVHIYYSDLNNTILINEIIKNLCPDEIYNLAAQSKVGKSFEIPELTADITALGSVRILEAIKKNSLKTKFYQASSSEMFGNSVCPQNEMTPFCPKSPYAISKLFSYWMTVNYRQSYKIFASNGILFNHESPRRSEFFISRKITNAIANILSGKMDKLLVGNLDAKRDWGFAPEFVEVMWLILQYGSPDDFVIGTGKSYSIREFISKAFDYCGVEIEWKNRDYEEIGIVKSVKKEWEDVCQVGKKVVQVDPVFFRPLDLNFIQADIGKAKKKLGWSPKIFLDDLVKIMIDEDFIKIGLKPIGTSFVIYEKYGLNYILKNRC